MGFRRWLAKKIVKGDTRQLNPGTDNFDDESREAGRESSAQVRRIRAEKRRLQEEMELMELKADYRRLKRDLEEYEDEANPDENADLFGGNNGPEALLSTIIGGALLGKNATNSGRPDPNSMQTQAQTQSTLRPRFLPIFPRSKLTLWLIKFRENI